MTMYIVKISVLKFHMVIKADTFREGTGDLLSSLSEILFGFCPSISPYFSLTVHLKLTYVK